MMTSLTLADCRPEVLAFALLMERELRNNDYKGGWDECDARDLVRRASEEVSELFIAVSGCDHLSPKPKAYRAAIAEEAADVANFVMMVTDVCGCLFAQTVSEQSP